MTSDKGAEAKVRQGHESMRISRTMLTRPQTHRTQEDKIEVLATACKPKRIKMRPGNSGRGGAIGENVAQHKSPTSGAVR